jgi:hypothetical protein
VQGTLGLESQNLDLDATNDHDFTFNINPTATTGFGMAAGVRAPRFLASGTGPTTPVLDDRRPVIVELEDWRDPLNPKIVSSLTLNNRVDDLVYEDAEIAADIGDIAITQSKQSIIFDDFEFGATMFSMNPVVNGQATEPVHQVLIACKPYQRWESYPAADTWNVHVMSKITQTGTGKGTLQWAKVYNDKSITEKITFTVKDATTLSVTSSANGAYPDAVLPAGDPYGYNYFPPHGGWQIAFGLNGGTFVAGDKYVFDIQCTVSESRLRDVTVPPPFKMRLRRLDNTLLYTFEMSDGLPINSPLMLQTRTADTPLRPAFNCGMMLPWSSHRPRLNAKAYKYYPGTTPGSWRPSMAKNQYASNPPIALLFGVAQINTFNHYWAAPRWPLGWAINAANNAKDPNSDPYTWDTTVFEAGWYLNPQGAPARAVGWDWEPGSISLHDWVTGPGGLRSDRVFLPTAIAAFMDNPTGTRARDGSSLRDNVDAWNKAYFNHSCHYTRDVKSFASLPIQEVLNGQWSYRGAYYSQHDDPTYVSGGNSRHIAVHGERISGAITWPKDRTGYATWSGRQFDDQHCYAAPEWVAMLFDSPMHLVSGKHLFIASTMAQLAYSDPTHLNDFGGRVIAWRWLHWTLAWKMGTKHDLGVPRSAVEVRWAQELENIYNKMVLPTTDPSNPGYMTDTSVCLRNLGQIPGGGEAYSDVRGSVGAAGNMRGQRIGWNALAYYMTGVFMLMKQTGAWDRMYNYNAHCKASLDFMMLCYDKFCVDYILDTKGRAEGNYPVISKVQVVGTTNLESNAEFHTFPANWAEWATWFPPVDQEDWIRDKDGKVMNGQRDAAQFGRSQWAYMRKDFFPEFPYPRLDEAIAAFDQYEADKKAYVDTIVSPYSKTQSDWSSKYPGFGRIKVPTVT